MAGRLRATAGTHPPFLSSCSVPGLALAAADALIGPSRGLEEPSDPAQVLHHPGGLLSFVGAGSLAHLRSHSSRRSEDQAPDGRAAGFLPPPSGTPDRVVYARGTGRVKGSGLDVRESLHAVLVVVLATSAYFNLTRLFLPEDAAGVDLAGLRDLRYKFARVSDPALRRRAWDLSPVGSVGALLKFGTNGSRDDQGRHQCVAIEATWTAESGVTSACSEAENCLKEGAVCSMQEPMTNALDSVRASLGVTMEQLFSILSASCVLRRRRAGKAVRFGDSTCLVRMDDSSWPLAAVRKTRSGGWICYSCRTSDADCEHSGAAAELAKGNGDESEDSDDGEIHEMDDNGEDTDCAASRDADGDPAPPAVDADAQPPPPPPPSRRNQLPHYRTSPHSTLPLPIVPSVVAQQERAVVLDALRDPAIILKYVAATHCNLCNLQRHPDSHVRPVMATLECGEGVVNAIVEVWRCTKCGMRIIPDGRKRGVVFQSASLLYCEAFLFELAVDLCRNGCSLSSSAYLREAYREMSASFTFPLSTLRLSSVTTLRSALVLYLSLVIDGLPAAVTECLKCRRADGSYKTIGFDGLQVGYGIQHILPFFRTSVRVHAVARASLIAHVITDEAICKALGRVLVSTAVPSLEASKAITTVAAMRGHVMAITLMVGYPVVDGHEVVLAGPEPHGEGVSRKRGWDPAVDGGARQELFAFFSEVFDCGRVARSLAWAVVGAQYDLRRRVPDVLMRRIEALLKDGGDKQATAEDDKDDEDDNQHENAGIEDTQGAGASVAGGDATAGNGNDWESDAGDDQVAHDDLLDEVFGDDYTPTEPLFPNQVEWDDTAPLRMYADVLDEPALADTGGARAAARLRDLILPPLPHIPSTAASSIKLVDFMRALVVDPFTVWAPGDQWGAVDALIEALSANDFSLALLAGALARDDVTEQRLLRGAVACLGPAFCLFSRVRELFVGVLTSLKKTCKAYDKHVADATEDADNKTNAAGARGTHDEGGDVGDSDTGGNRGSSHTGTGGDGDDCDEGGCIGEPISRLEMSLAHPSHTFTPQQYTATWLTGEATEAGYRAVYNDATDQGNDYLRSGVWAPGLPCVRAMPGFVGAASAQTDAPDCQHEMGKKNRRTAGTFGVTCNCTHPKCVGVVVLDGAEGQRMPIEFVVQRFATLPDVIVYDFACATLKTALVRLPYVAKRVALRVDRFHWRKNHKDCTKAMCPDSYMTMDGTNTSSSEERNALSRRQQHHLRQMNQKHFIIFSVYQQALSNVIALYRDNLDKHTTSKWPEWFRRVHVDNV